MTHDLQRALAEIDRMIEEERKLTEQANRMYDRKSFGIYQARMGVLKQARSRLAALATTTPDTIPREGEA